MLVWCTSKFIRWCDVTWPIPVKHVCYAGQLLCQQNFSIVCLCLSYVNEDYFLTRTIIPKGNTY